MDNPLRGKEGRHRPPNATSRAWQCLRSYGFSDRERDEKCALALAWKHAPNPALPAPRSRPRAALSLARERFAEKRASGSRPCPVVRRSCLRPRGGVRIAGRGEATRAETHRLSGDVDRFWFVAERGASACSILANADRPFGRSRLARLRQASGRTGCSFRDRAARSARCGDRVPRVPPAVRIAQIGGWTRWSSGGSRHCEARW